MYKYDTPAGLGVTNVIGYLKLDEESLNALLPHSITAEKSVECMTATGVRGHGHQLRSTKVKKAGRHGSRVSELEEVLKQDGTVKVYGGELGRLIKLLQTERIQR